MEILIIISVILALNTLLSILKRTKKMNIFQTISNPIYTLCDKFIPDHDGSILNKLRDILAVIVFNSLFFGLLMIVPVLIFYSTYVAKS